MNDIDLKDRTIHLFEGEKNSMGRVVYLSNDAVFCLKRWFRLRDQEKAFIFYGKDSATFLTELFCSFARVGISGQVSQAHFAHCCFLSMCRPKIGQSTMELSFFISHLSLWSFPG
jgi:integrase